MLMYHNTTQVLAMEPNPSEWAGEELIRLCQLTSSTSFVDFATPASLPWSRDEGPDADMISGLHKGLQPLVRLLNDNGCNHLMVNPSKGGVKNVLASRY